MSDADTLEILIKGALVIIGAVLLIAVSIPIAFLWILWQLAKRIFAFLLPFLQREPVYQPTPADLRRMAEKINREKQQVEEPEPQDEEESEETEEDEIQEEDESDSNKETEKEDERFNADQNIYLEGNLKYREKEELFARGYKRLKISPYGDSGASYYWVRIRYNEGKEHAFFCYLIEKELHKYTDEITMYTNNGPDVVFKHNNRWYCGVNPYLWTTRTDTFQL